MRLACLHLPEFAVQVERHANPALRGVPLVVGGYHHESGYVRECSAEAAGFGVAPDMPLRQAYRLCPSGTFLPYREERYRQAFSAVVYEVAQLCPLVEPIPPAHLLLGLRYERDERKCAQDVIATVQQRLGFEASCGIASSRFAARVAAEDAPLRETTVVESGGGREFLRSLPVGRLPLSDATSRRLRLLGMVRAGDLLALPAGALEAQFGKEGQALLEVVRGEDTREVEPWKGVRELEQCRCFDMPVTHGGELLDAARELLDTLCCELQSRWQCCRSLSVTLGLENGASRQDVLHFKQPASSLPAMGRRVAACIERLSGDGAVELLCLRAFDLCAGTGTQSSFLDDLPRQARQFKEAVGVLQERFGSDVMKKVVTRPGGRLPEERFSFVPCEPEVR